MTPTEHVIEGLTLITQLCVNDLFIFSNDPLERKYLLVHRLRGTRNSYQEGTYLFYYLPWERYDATMSTKTRRLHLRLLCMSVHDAETTRSLQVFFAGHVRRSSPPAPFLL